MRKKLFLLLITLLNAVAGFSQCFTVADGNGNQSSRPYWVSCNGSNFTIFIQPNRTISAYTINFGDGNSSAGPGLAVPNFIQHTYTATVDTFVVTLTETATGCVVTGVVVMEGTPSASIQIPFGNPTYGCTPATFLFENQSTNVSKTTHFTWSFGDGTPIQNYDYTNLGQTVSHTYLPGTTNCNIPITLTAENYCNRGNPSINIYQPIQVWDIDNAGITPDRSVLCFPNNTFHFDNTTNLNCYALGNNSQRYEYWNFGNYWGKGHDSIVNWQPYNPPTRPGYTLSYPGVGSYNVMLIDSSFCGNDTAYTTVSIVLPPTAGFNQSRDTICQGESVTFTNTSTGGTSYSWNFNDGTPIINSGSTAPINHIFNNAGDFNVVMIVSSGAIGGCSDTISKNVHVKPSPTADFTMDNPVWCDSGIVNFSDASLNAIAWTWNFSGTPFLGKNPPPQHYTNTGNYGITLTVLRANGCTSSKTDSVHIYKSPQALIGTPQSVCVNTLAAFTDSSQSAAGDPITSWTWNFGDGSPVSHVKNPFHSYSSGGAFVVTLNVATAHCNGTQGTRTIQIYAPPVAGMVLDKNSGCTPLKVTFQDTSKGPGIISYQWIYNDGSPIDTAKNPSHIFTNINNTTLTRKVLHIVSNTNGCYDTTFQNIDIYPGPQAFFTSDFAPSCSPLPVNFTNGSINANNYQWYFGDGSTSSAINPTHTFLNNTQFLLMDTVLLVASTNNSCVDSISQSILIYPSPVYNIFANSTSGCNPLTVNFTASSSGIIYNWNFGDGDSVTSQNPTHIFTNTGDVDSVYHVTLRATNAFFCTGTQMVDITVFPIPHSNFIALPDSQVFPATTVSLQNNSTGSSSYNWDFGDNNTSTSQNPGNHVYASWGKYTITLISISNNSCTDTSSKQIIIKAPKPIAEFTLSNDEGCRPLDVFFNPAPSQYENSYLWVFGDGGTSSQSNPLYTYHDAGTYQTTLYVTGDGGKDTLTREIIVHEKPVVFFTVTPSVVYIPSTPAYFKNLTTFGDTYQWYFGDGNISTDKNPIHLYQTTGKFDVTLIARNIYGCSDTLKQPEIVSGEERGDIRFPNAFKPSNLGPSGGAYDANSFENTVFFPFTEGVTEYKLMIFNRWGELIFESTDINIGWDGYYKGKLCEQDVYVWKVVARFADGRLVNKAGDVTLLR